MNAVDILYLKQWEGRTKHIDDVLRDFPARAFANALDLSQLPAAGDALPPAWQWLYFLEAPATAQTNVDGHALTGDFLPPVPLPRRMWAAGSMQIEQPLRIGGEARKVSRIRSVNLKEGKSGAMVFVEVQHEISQGGTCCVREQQTLVYLQIPSGMPATPPPDPAPTPSWSRVLRADSRLLFRYSALTYNAHRIHYDREYAMQQEHYPGLVVHGPLLATLLLDLVARERPQAQVQRFEFRVKRPTFDLHPVRIEGQPRGQSVSLWSADAENNIGILASAELNGS